jgi:hypothetical protein
MLIYIIIFLFLMIATLVDSFGSKVSAKIILFGSLIILLIITTLREGIGTDFYNYKEIYDLTTINHDYTTEYGFILLIYFAYFLGGFKLLLFITAILNISIIYYLLKQFKLNIYIGLLTYYSIFYLNHNFNVIRHGLMSTIIWISFYCYLNRKKIKSFIFFILSFLIHQTSIIILPFIFLVKRSLNLFSSILILFILFFFGRYLDSYFEILNIFSFDSSSGSKISFYLNDYNIAEKVRYRFGFGFFLYVTVYLLLIKFEKEFTNKEQIIFFKQILFLAISILCIFASLSILSERVANTLLLSIIFIFSSIGKLKIKPIYKICLLVVIILIDFTYLYQILNIAGIDRPKQFLPYNYSLNF